MPLKPARCSQSPPPDIPPGPNISFKPVHHSQYSKSRSNSAAEVLVADYTSRLNTAIPPILYAFKHPLERRAPIAAKYGVDPNTTMAGKWKSMVPSRIPPPLTIIHSGKSADAKKAGKSRKRQQNYAIKEGSREFSIVLETVSATGKVLPLWKGKIHTTSCYVKDDGIYSNAVATFGILDSRYMGDKLGWEYMVQYFDRYMRDIPLPPPISILQDELKKKHGKKTQDYDNTNKSDTMTAAGKKDNIMAGKKENAIASKDDATAGKSDATADKSIRRSLEMPPLPTLDYNRILIVNGHSSHVNVPVVKSSTSSTSSSSSKLENHQTGVLGNILINIKSAWKASGYYPINPWEKDEEEIQRTAPVSILDTPTKIHQLSLNMLKLAPTLRWREEIKNYIDYVSEKIMQYREIAPRMNTLHTLYNDSNNSPESSVDGLNQSSPTDRLTISILEVKGGGQLLVGKEGNGRLEGKRVVKGDELGLQIIR
ncbi:hypothetical protein BDZ91DRAFT_792109 [Kalaharituber pfeilii]|nr:hypothetical protein BDZ91DRAFT_792109 [Kalaharituber pfeilii]